MRSACGRPADCEPLRRRLVQQDRVVACVRGRGEPHGLIWVRGVDNVACRGDHRDAVATQFPVRVTERRDLTGAYFVLELESAAPAAMSETAPGQFVMLRGEWGRDLLNGRAFSVLQAHDDRRFSILAKPFGRGTTLMSRMEVGAPMLCTGPLGKGFPLAREGVTQLLVAGGVGLPPLHLHARVAASSGMAGRVEMFYGGRTAADLVLVEDLERWGVKTVLSTDDGSRGVKGTVVDPLTQRLAMAEARGEPVELLSCGPTPMLRAVRSLGLAQGVTTYLCLEEQMACGFGVCLGCAVPVYGSKPFQYCCTDGPVFEAKEIRW